MSRGLGNVISFPSSKGIKVTGVVETLRGKQSTVIAFVLLYILLQMHVPVTLQLGGGSSCSIQSLELHRYFL